MIGLGLMILQGLSVTSEKEVTTLVMDYIQWTTTGKSSADELFSESTELFYYVEDRYEQVDAEEYKIKVQHAASTVPREMNIQNLMVMEDVAHAEVVDHSLDHGFSLTHHLVMIKSNEAWKIQSIKIVPNK